MKKLRPTAFAGRLALAFVCCLLLAACSGGADGAGAGDPGGGDVGGDAAAEDAAGDDASSDAGGTEDGASSEDTAGADTVESDGDGAEDAAADDTSSPDASGADAGPDTIFFPDVGADGGGADTPPPTDELTLFAVEPNRGPTDGGTEIVIIGFGFTPETDVLLNGKIAEDIDVVDEATITAVTPTNPEGLYDVKVVNSGGEAILRGGFSYFTRPRIDAVEPSAGPVRGGVPLTIHGAGFADDSLVSVGGRLGTEIFVRDRSTIELVSPPSFVTGAVPVRVTNENGTAALADGYEYFSNVRIDSIDPAAGPTTGGTEVRVAGTGFGESPQVLVGGREATSSLDDGVLVVVTPPGAAGPADVTVVSGRGEADTVVGGFRYVDASTDELAVVGVLPERGSVSGGTSVTVAGTGLEDVTAVTFGGEAATIITAVAGGLRVVTPAGERGPVDVTATTPTGSATLEDGYVYEADLSIMAVEPPTGDVDGGTAVTVTGTGFTSQSRVSFGPVPATETAFVSDTELTAVTPPGSIGPIDVHVDVQRRRATLADGFEYTEEAGVTSFSPTRGSMSGGTLVFIRGRGFHEDVSVKFGELDAASVEVLDGATLAARTPPSEEGRVPVTVSIGDELVEAPGRFEFFDPFSPSGGLSGGEIIGAVNVTVINSGGEPLEGAFVTLSVRADDEVHSGTTDERGQVTISGEDLSGLQTIHASAPEHSSVTITSFNAENVTIVLTFICPDPSDPRCGGEPPPPPPVGFIEGNLTGLNKIDVPAPDERILGVVFTTNPDPFSGNPDPGDENVVVDRDGPFRLISRLGDLAVVAACGLFNTRTEEFRPLYMGVVRRLNVREGESYDVDIECDIPLDQTLQFKLITPPTLDVPQINRVTPFLDFGSEGVFGGLVLAEGTGSTVSATGFPELSGVLSDVVYFVMGGTYPADGAGVPFSTAILRDVSEVDRLITLPALLPPAELTTPRPGGRIVGRRVEWTLSTERRPDFYYAYIQDIMQQVTFWEIFVPGDETGFNLPYFPPDAPTGPFPPGEPLVLIIISADAFTFDFDAWEFNDFSINNWQSYSAGGWVFINE